MLDTREDLTQQNKQLEYLRLELMLKSLAAYKNKLIELGQLASDIESLIGGLSECDEECKNEFRSYWATLEIEYSFLVAHNKLFLSDEEQKDVDEAINDLERLARERIKLYESYLDKELLFKKNSQQPFATS